MTDAPERHRAWHLEATARLARLGTGWGDPAPGGRCKRPDRLPAPPAEKLPGPRQGGGGRDATAGAPAGPAAHSARPRRPSGPGPQRRPRRRLPAQALPGRRGPGVPALTESEVRCKSCCRFRPVVSSEEGFVAKADKYMTTEKNLRW